MKGSHFSRRDLLRTASALGAGTVLASCQKSSQRSGVPQETAQAPSGPADITIHINEVLVDVAKNHTISTRGYNGSVPGPLIRLREGVPVAVELFNETDTPELVHWHGQIIPSDVDGAEEERSIVVPARGNVRYRLTPSPAGARFVHTHVMCGPNLHQGTYTGQFAPVYIEPKSNPGNFDQEVFLSTHEWEPFFMAEGEEEEEEGKAGENEKKEHKEEKPNGWEVGYQLFSINGKALGFGDPVRVREGQRVLFHILNGSATENIQLALPGHRFQVIALDGNLVPTPQTVDVLELGTAERVDAIVEMKNPGVWILGTPKDDDRKNGMGIVVEYANKSGMPRWIKPPKSSWDYTAFGAAGRVTPAPDHTIPMVFGKINGGREQFNHWTINGKSFDAKDQPQALRKGARYRLAFDNQTDDAHPLHLHRNTFELTKVYGKPTAGVLKDVVLIKPFSKIEVDFTATNPGLTLFHCHQQLHMDYGFKKVFHVA